MPAASVAGTERPRTECLFPRLAAPSPAPSRLSGGRSGLGGSVPRRSRSEAALSGTARQTAASRLAFGGDVPPPTASELSACTTVFSAVTTDFCPQGPSRRSLSATLPDFGATLEGAAAADLDGDRVFTPVPILEQEGPPGARRLPARKRQSQSDGPPAGAGDVPYKTSVVSSVGSAWMLEYYQEPGHAFSRGLRSLDPRQATQCNLGTCCEKEMVLPRSPAGRSEERKRRNLEYLAGELRRLGVDSPAPSNALRRGPNGEAPTCATVARARYHTYVLEKPRGK